tara:strand:- start:120 stop:782 length:663 start_codon:yes stop_codon:yes gene_type:complete
MIFIKFETMKNILFAFFIILSHCLFSQDSRDAHYLLNDLKIGVYESQNNPKDTLGIFIAQTNRKGDFSVCIDVLSNKRKNTYRGLGISIDANRFDRLYRDLRVAQKEFQDRVNKKNTIDNMRIGGQTPVDIYQWDSKDKNGPLNRISQKNKQTSYPLSIELITKEGQQELWIYTSGESSNPKEISIIFDDPESVDSFLNSIEPGSFREKHYRNFKLKKKK